MKNYQELFIILFFILPPVSFAQNSDTSEVATRFSGIVTVSSKGISMIPNLSLSATFNNPVSTEIAAGNGFLWNVNLVYSFGKEYVENNQSVSGFVRY